MSDESAALIELGAVGAPFGVRGWVKLRSYTDPPDRLLEYPRLQLRLGGVWKPYAVEDRGRSGGQLTVKLAGVGDRNAALALRAAPVGLPRSALPPSGARDFYRADLIGCEVQSVAGVALGVLEHFVETPAHPVMVVRGAREYWVPAVPPHLHRVDLAARRVVVAWDEPAE